MADNAEGLPLRLLLETAPDGFAVIDPAGAIVWANRMVEELFDYGRDELIGARVELLMPERFHSAHLGHRQDFVAGPRLRPMGLGLNLVGRKKGGKEFPLEIRLSPIHTQEGLLVIAVIRDVSESRQVEEERNLLRIDLETERERDRIAMDLHDGIMQDIYAATLTLEFAEAIVADEKFADAAGVDRAIHQLRDVIRNMRSYIFDLRPREFSGDLAVALTDLAREFKQNSGIDTAAEVNGHSKINPETALALYHIAHESLSNIQRHARASHVRIVLSADGAAGGLEIEDDGVGFDPDAGLSEEHRGVRNMAARAHSVGGTFRLESAPGQGTRASVRFPLDHAR